MFRYAKRAFPNPKHHLPGQQMTLVGGSESFSGRANSRSHHTNRASATGVTFCLSLNRNQHKVELMAALAKNAQRVMIVTGAGRGIGAAIAKKAAADGYAVVVNYARSANQAHALVSHIKADGGTAIAVQADLNDEAGILGLFDAVDESFGRVDVLVNNAGIDLERPIIEVSREHVERLFRINVTAPILCAREAVKRMATSRGGDGGVIINIGSTAARTGGMPHDVIYTASKGAIDAFSLALAKEVGRQGIRVCSLRPGIIETDIFSTPGMLDRVREVARETVPIGRTGQPEDVAAAVLWLCSPEAAYVNGFPIDVSGGR